jgi:hypothetical protein
MPLSGPERGAGGVSRRRQENDRQISQADFRQLIF